MIDLLSLNIEDMEVLMKDEGFPSFRGRQLFQWCHEKEVQQWKEMKNLPQNMITWLQNHGTLNRGSILEVLTGKDENTVKFLISFPEDVLIETVLMCYEREESRNRTTLCVSTQGGCNMKCRFCASTVKGLERNLTSGEIVAQVYIANEYLRKNNRPPVTNLVYMGMGEPLQNLDAVKKSIEILHRAKNIGMRRITLSTAGLVREMKVLADLELQLTLAVSLHAPNNILRDELMPINKKYPIEQLMDGIDYYTNKTGRRVTIEYAVFQDVNDSDATAEELKRLLKGHLINVNLLQGNPVAESNLQRGSAERVLYFSKKLNEAGIETTIRESRGLDIDGACGQLRNKRR